jgi:hypothetical protein
MTSTTREIVEIAEKLSPEAQIALLDVARSLAGRSFYDVMTPAQRGELEQAIAEAERGEVVDQVQLDRELDDLLARKQ